MFRSPAMLGAPVPPDPGDDQGVYIAGIVTSTGSGGVTVTGTGGAGNGGFDTGAGLL